MNDAEAPELPPGHSREQQEAERHMLDALGESLQTTFMPRRVETPSGISIELDGVNPDQTILVECWAHQGTVKGGQRNKPILDAFKLMWLAATMDPRPRLLLCMSDDEAAKPFISANSWRAQALRDVGVNVQVVPLPDDIRRVLEMAQIRQAR